MLQCLPRAGIQSVWIDHYLFPAERCQVLCEGFVGRYFHIGLFLQLFSRIRGYFLRLHEQHGPLRLHGKVGDKKRIIVDIPAAQVQCPGNLVQHGDYPYSILRLLLTDASQFMGRALPTVVLRQHDNRFRGHGWSPLPNRGERVVRCPQLQLLFDQFPLELVNRGAAEECAVHANYRVGVEMLLQPLRQARRPRYSHPLQLDAAPLQLRLRLQEVTRVGPQCSLFGRYDHRPGRTVETAYPGSTAPVRSHIFTEMGVVRGNHKGSQAMVVHPLPQGGKTLRYGCGDSHREARVDDYFENFISSSR